MASAGNLVFFTTAAHHCSYLDDRSAVTLFADPDAVMDASLYSHLSGLGFRRSGNYVYRPQCHGCRACVSVRVPVQQFCASRSQRRILKQNQDLTTTVVAAEWHDEHYELYRHYIESRHADGDMYPPSPRQYREFLLSDWADSVIMEIRHHDRLVAAAVMDVLADGYSAVYTFYNTQMPERSLGTFAILQQIAWLQSQRLPYLYLGYWVKDAKRMSYKKSFRPLELLIDGEWLLAR